MSNYLCDELIDNIFTRLPPKSLVRFRCLSKSFSSRIRNPDFIRNHVLRFDKNPQKILIKHRTWAYSDMQCFYTLHPENQLPLHGTQGYMGIPGFLCDDRSIIVNSCNGVFCLFDRKIGTTTLWNPSIRRKLLLPPHSCMWSFTSQESRRVVVGFGFDPVTEDYKIVKISFSMSEISVAPKSLVYTLNTGTWTAIAPPTTRLLSNERWCCACFVNGALHWIVAENDNTDHCYIMSFDLSTEVFGRVPLPESSYKPRELTVINGCLAVLTGHCPNTRIWVMKEENNVVSWSMFFKLEGDLPREGGIHKVLLLTTNGDIVFQTYHTEGYKVYNLATGERSRLMNFNDSSTHLDIVTYVESLVLLNESGVLFASETDLVGSDQKRESRKRNLRDFF